MLKKKTKIQKRLAKIVLTALLCTGGVHGLYSPSTVEASEVTVTNITGTTGSPVFTTIPAGAHYSGDGGYVSYHFDDAGVNTLNITGSEVNDILISGMDTGGYAGDVTGYTVNVSGTNTTLGWVYGGVSWNGTASGNTVEISDGTIGAVFGGCGSQSSSATAGDATDNHVIVSGGTINNWIRAGQSGVGDANLNTISISGSATKVKGDVIGGLAWGSGDVAQNKVTITGGEVGTSESQSIRGGDAQGYGTTLSGSANKNTVEISGGTINSTIWGGFSSNGNADDNTVTISGNPTFGADSGIHGAAAGGNATNNKVNILANNIAIGYLIGGEPMGGGTSSGNTLNIAAKGVTTGMLNPDGDKTFQNMNFYLPSDIAKDDTMLTVNGSAKTDVTGVTFGVAALSGVKLVKGDTVNLLVNSNGLNTDDTLKTVESSKLADAEFLAPNSLATDTKYELSIEKKGTTAIIAKVDNVKEDSGPSPTPGPDPTPTPTPTPTPDYSNNERLKSLVETREAAATMLNAGTDLLTGQGMQNAADAAAERDAGGGFNTFAAVGVSKLRAQSGSHVDTKGIGLNLGFAREIENKSGKLLFGPVLEYGHGSYDSYQDNGIKADGKASYWGIGIIARQTNNNGLYYEGSVRAGRVKSDYDSDLSAVTHASYDSSSTYWAAHAGIGKLMDIGNNNTLDVYGKYFYSHTGSDSVTVHATGGDEEINFRGVNSHRVRAGARFIHAINEKNKIYGGLAYQYEFGGEARAIYNGGSTPSPSVKGSSGLIELGWQVKPGKSPMTIDLGVTGWVGKQRGITANVQANWTF